MIRCFLSSTIVLLLVSVLGTPAHAATSDVQNIIDQRVQGGMATGLVVGDVLDVLEHLKGEYGSFANAAVQCVRGSEIYEKARRKMAEDEDASEVPDGG